MVFHGIQVGCHSFCDWLSVKPALPDSEPIQHYALEVLAFLGKTLLLGWGAILAFQAVCAIGAVTYLLIPAVALTLLPHMFYQVYTIGKEGQPLDSQVLAEQLDHLATISNRFTSLRLIHGGQEPFVIDETCTERLYATEKGKIVCIHCQIEPTPYFDVITNGNQITLARRR